MTSGSQGCINQCQWHHVISAREGPLSVYVSNRRYALVAENPKDGVAHSLRLIKGFWTSIFSITLASIRFQPIMSFNVYNAVPAPHTTGMVSTRPFFAEPRLKGLTPPIPISTNICATKIPKDRAGLLQQGRDRVETSGMAGGISIIWSRLSNWKSSRRSTTGKCAPSALGNTSDCTGSRYR